MRSSFATSGLGALHRVRQTEALVNSEREYIIQQSEYKLFESIKLVNAARVTLESATLFLACVRTRSERLSKLTEHPASSTPS